MNINARAKKSRSSSARGGRGKGIERQLSANASNGVYNNHRFMQTVGALVGLPVQVLTRTKDMFEGVLTTFSPSFEIVLDWPHSVPDGFVDTSVICNKDLVKRKMIFEICDVVQIRVINVNMEHVSKDSFAVDSQISKYNGRVIEKELEPWHGDAVSHGELGEDLEESANGWDADDMFKKNEEKYGVQTTYDPDMEGYTTPLQKKNTKEYKEQEAKAQKIALEIEHSPITQTRAQVENGEDEEEKFSAVVRPDQASAGGTAGKYMPPQRRKIQGSNNKQATRGTPSPQSSSSGPSHISGNRYNNHNSSPTTSQQSSPISPSTMGPPTSYASQTKLQHQKTTQPSSDVKLNGDNKESRRHEYVRDNKENFSVNKEIIPQSRDSFSHNKEGFPQSKESFPQNKESYAHSKENFSHAKENYSQDSSHSSHHHHSQSFSHAQSYHPSSDSRRSEPREQREPRKPRNQKEEQLAELRKFGQDFNLTESVEKKSAQHQIMHPQSTQMQPQQANQYTANQHPSSLQQSGHQQTQNQMHPVSQHMQNQQQQGSGQQQQNLHTQNQQIQQQVIQPSINSNVSQGAKHHSHSVPSASQVSSQPTSQTHLPVSQVPPLSHPVSLNEPQQTTANTPAHSQPQPMSQEIKDDDKSSSSISSSKLNPNAKEFVFNPNAKPFSPRSPSTASPPRTQTPQIQPSQPQQMGAAGVPSLNFPQNMVPTYVMTQHYPMPQPRFAKRVPVGNQRQDYASSMQVAAATGHPILAPAPLTPITAPQTLSAVQIPQNMMQQTAQHYQYQGMPMMVRFPGPGIPMVTTMVPTSMGMYHQMEAHQNSHNHPHLYMGPTAGVAQHQQHQPHPSVTPGPHPGQPPTPQGHNNGGGPNTIPNIPPQPPTPGPTPPQNMMYGGPAGAQMGGQPTITQHIPHTAQSPHNQYPGSHNAALAAAAAASASHHAPTTQLVMIPPHMTHHMLPPGAPPHSATGHIPSSIAGYTPTSSGTMQHINHGAQLHYIPAGAPPGGQRHLSIVHNNQ